MKRNEDSLRDIWDKCTSIHIIIGVPKEKRERESKKIFEKIIGENFPQEKGNSQPNSGNTESPRQNRNKKEYTKAHSNQTNKNYR